MPDKGFVLLTNHWLRGLSGTEVATRDFALGLAGRGWRVGVFSPNGVAFPRELPPLVQAVNDLSLLDGEPDVIHGHHHPSLAIAMMRFPAAPAVQLCHDAKAWADEALLLERVRRRLAVDEACRERVVLETGLAETDVAIVPNAIDLTRFPPRGALPAWPRTALIIANRDASHVPALEAACAAAGIETRAIGFGVDQPSDDIGAAMAGADIVFGAARLALEAMAVGCAVVVCDARGLAGMATAEDYAAWRRFNFGWRLLTQTVTPESAAAAIAGYDAADAMALSAQARLTCGLGHAIDALEAAYEQVIAEHRPGQIDPVREAQALSAYLQRWLPISYGNSPFRFAFEELRTELRQSQAKLDGLTAELARRGMTVTFRTEPPPEP